MFASHLQPGTVVQMHETRPTHPLYFDGPLAVVGVGNVRGKARRVVLDRVLTGRIKFTRLAGKENTYSLREVGKGSRGRTLYFRGDATVFYAGATGSVADLFTAAMQAARRSA